MDRRSPWRWRARTLACRSSQRLQGALQGQEPWVREPRAGQPVERGLRGRHVLRGERGFEQHARVGRLPLHLEVRRGQRERQRRVLFDRDLRAACAEAAWTAGQTLPRWTDRAAAFAAECEKALAA